MNRTLILLWFRAWLWSNSATLWTVARQAPLSMGILQPTGVGCHFLLQGIFPTQGLNLCLPNCRQILYHLSHQGSPWSLLSDCNFCLDSISLSHIPCLILTISQTPASKLGKWVSESEWKLVSRVQLFATPGLYSPWNSPGQNTGVGSFSLLQGIFPTQGSNLGLPHCRWILYRLSHKGSPQLGKEYVKAVYCHSAYLTYMQSTSCKMPSWMKLKLEPRLLGEISTTSDTQTILP